VHRKPTPGLEPGTLQNQGLPGSTTVAARRADLRYERIVEAEERRSESAEQTKTPGFDGLKGGFQ
jgi:hypothetical protein